jgi:chromosome partitioning protein
MVKSNQLNLKLEIMGVLCTFAENTNVSSDVNDQLRAHFGDLVFETSIPKNVSLGEADSRHTHKFEHAANSAGARAYKELVKKFLYPRPEKLRIYRPYSLIKRSATIIVARQPVLKSNT